MCTLPTSGSQVVDHGLLARRNNQTSQFIDQNRPSLYIAASLARSYNPLAFCPVWHEYTFSCMPDGVVSWLHSAGLGPGGTVICSFSDNGFSFSHQVTNELVDGAAADCMTHTIHILNSITIHAFLLLIEVHMCDRVKFPLTENHFFNSLSPAREAPGPYCLFITLSCPLLPCSRIAASACIRIYAN